MEYFSRTALISGLFILMNACLAIRPLFEVIRALIGKAIVAP